MNVAPQRSWPTPITWAATKIGRRTLFVLILATVSTILLVVGSCPDLSAATSKPRQVTHAKQHRPAAKGHRHRTTRKHSSRKTTKKARSSHSRPAKKSRRHHTSRRKRHRSRRRHRRWHARVSRRYRAWVTKWHKPTTSPAPVDSHGRSALVLEVLNTGERISVFPVQDDGGFDVPSLEKISHALRDQRKNNRRAMDLRLVNLLYQLQRHFHAGAIRIVSGYRTPKRGSGSRHGQGRAVDMIVPGASDQKVAAYLRGLGHTGVGIYPTSGFVHLDVREKSYYWRDRSGPGQRNRTRGILGKQATNNDKKTGASPTSKWSAPKDDIEGLWTSQENAKP